MASPASPPKTMQTIRIPSPNGPWTLDTVPIPTPGPTQVLVKISCCGICGTDIWLAEGKLSFSDFPLSIGHEAIGTIAAHGSAAALDANAMPIGTRVGICLLQSSCGTCTYCNEHPNSTSLSAARNCSNAVLTGFNTPHGAQSEYVCVEVEGVVRIPDGIGKEGEGIGDEVFAPMMCAGYSAWCGLLKGEPRPGETVAVVGVGGIGHLAVMMARGCGLRTVAVVGEGEKRGWVKGLAEGVEIVGNGVKLKEIGGVDVLLACGSDNRKVQDSMMGLRPGGRVVLMGICFRSEEGKGAGGPEGLVIDNMQFLFNGLQVRGSSHNGKEYLVQALQMVTNGKIKPVVEVFGVKDIEQAAQRAMSGKARGRVVVKWD